MYGKYNTYQLENVYDRLSDDKVMTASDCCSEEYIEQYEHDTDSEQDTEFIPNEENIHNEYNEYIGKDFVTKFSKTHVFPRQNSNLTRNFTSYVGTTNI